MTREFEKGDDKTGQTPEIILGATTADRVVAIIEGYLESAETIPPALVPFNIDLMNLASEHQDQSAIKALGEPGVFNGNVDRAFTTLAGLNVLRYRSGEGFRVEHEQRFQTLQAEAAKVLGQEDYEVLKELGKSLGENATSDVLDTLH